MWEDSDESGEIPDWHGKIPMNLGKFQIVWPNSG